MPRIRTIKPEIWNHHQLGELSLLARLTFHGLISLADDEGRGRADKHALWGALHGHTPLNVKARWSQALNELAACADERGPLVVFYERAGARYYWLPGFSRNQKIDRPSKSKLPPPPVSTSPRDKSPLDQGSGIEDQGRGEGSATDAPTLPVESNSPPQDEASARETTPQARIIERLNELKCPSSHDQKLRHATAWIARFGSVEVVLEMLAADELKGLEAFKIGDILSDRKVVPTRKQSKSQASPAHPQVCPGCRGTGWKTVRVIRTNAQGGKCEYEDAMPCDVAATPKTATTP